MEIENKNKEILRKYENYSFLEFSIKSSLFQEYIIALRELKFFDIIDSIFENYVEMIIKIYSKNQNPYFSFSLETCKKNKKISKLFQLATIVRKFIILF